MTAAATPDRQMQEHKLIMYATRSAGRLVDLLRRAEQHVDMLHLAIEEAVPAKVSAQDRLDRLAYLVSRALRIFEDDRDRIHQEAIDHDIIDTDGNLCDLPVQIGVAS